MKPMQIMITIHKTKPPTMIAMKKGCEIKSESDCVKEFVIHVYFQSKKILNVENTLIETGGVFVVVLIETDDSMTEADEFSFVFVAN